MRSKIVTGTDNLADVTKVLIQTNKTSPSGGGLFRVYKTVKSRLNGSGESSLLVFPEFSGVRQAQYAFHNSGWLAQGQSRSLCGAGA